MITKSQIIDLQTALDTKVDKVQGKGLSTNDYSDAEKAKVASAYQKPATGIPSTDLAEGTIPDVSSFITKSVDDLMNYYLKSETYTKAEVQALIGAIRQFHYEIYASTDAVTSPAGNVLYLIGPASVSGSDKYEEYVYANNAFVKIGDTSIDLSGYVTTTALNAALAAKANVDGYYQKMVVGLAENLVDTKGQGAEQQFIRRTSCGEESISDDGVAQIQEVRGSSNVWNQIIGPRSIRFLASQNDRVTIVSNGDGSYQLSVLTELSERVDSQSIFNVVVGHKYLLLMQGATDIIYRNESRGNMPTGTIKQFINESYTSVRIRVQPSCPVGTYTIRPAVFDLTRIFGAGNEPSTLAEFEALFPLPLYAYCAGRIINNVAGNYVTDGFNQYNPASGKANVLKGRQYQITGTYTELSLNGENVIPDASGLFTPSDDGELIVTGGNSTDTCVHLTWSGYRNGEYEPYWKRELTLNITTLTGKLNGEGESVVVAPEGLRSNGATYDKGIVEGGYLTKIVLAVGKRAYVSGDELDGTVTTDNTDTLYNLATPVTYVLDTPIRMATKIADFGTEGIEPQGVDENGVPKSAPFRAVIKYNDDYTRKLATMEKNFTSKETMDALLSTLSTALNVTLTKTWDAVSGKWTFAFTPNSSE